MRTASSTSPFRLAALFAAAAALLGLPTAVFVACQQAPCSCVGEGCINCPGTPDAAIPDSGLDAHVTVDASTFACGETECIVGIEYCRHVLGGVPPGIDETVCAPLPDAGCDSIAECTCTEDGGAVFATCNVP